MCFNLRVVVAGHHWPTSFSSRTAVAESTGPYLANSSTVLPTCDVMLCLVCHVDRRQGSLSLDYACGLFSLSLLSVLSYTADCRLAFVSPLDVLRFGFCCALLPPPFLPDQDTLGTFEVAATLGEEALGAQVISMASSPSDVLAVKLMQARQVILLSCLPSLDFLLADF